MDQSLCGTSLTGHKLQDLLSNSPSSNINGHKLLGVDAYPISESQGFTSKIMRLHLTWSSIEPHLPSTLAVKMLIDRQAKKHLEIVTGDQTLDAPDQLNDQFAMVHNTECAFYELNLHESIGFQKCYASQKATPDQPGIIVLEDLSEYGKAMPLTISGIGLNLAQVDQLLDKLTSVHAWSFNTHVDWPSKIPTVDKFKIVTDFEEYMVSTFPQTKSAYPHVFEDFEFETLKSLVNRDRYLEIFGSDPRIRYGLPLVLVHGDCHLGNMFYEKGENGLEYGDKLIAILDWQICHQGCGLEDVAYFCVMQISTEMRREKTDWILERYVQLFNSKVQNDKHKITVANAKRAFDDFFAYISMKWSSTFPVLISFAHQSKEMNDEEKKLVADRIAQYHIDNFMDARKILGV